MFWNTIYSFQIFLIVSTPTIYIDLIQIRSAFHDPEKKPGKATRIFGNSQKNHLQKEQRRTFPRVAQTGGGIADSNELRKDSRKILDGLAVWLSGCTGYHAAGLEWSPTRDGREAYTQVSVMAKSPQIGIRVLI